MNIKHFFYFLAILLSLQANAQLYVDTKVSAAELVNEVFLGEATNIQVLKADFIGHPYAIGTFEHPSDYAFFKKGIVLSTGYLQDAVGPNTLPNQGVPLMRKGDIQLTRLTSIPTFDATALVFDFIPQTDSIGFEFFFASEEYPEYVNKGVNDAFGFFLIEFPDGNATNIAQLPDGKGVITVDNVNSNTNPEYYFENGIWDEENILQWEDKRELGEFTYSYQFDGFTRVIPVGVKVVPGKTYRLKMVIADVGDAEYDSAVFLKAKSFVNTDSREKQEKKKKEVSEVLKQYFDSSNLKQLSATEFLVIGNVEFDFDKSSIRATEQPTLKKVEHLLREYAFFDVEIVGHTDSKGSDAYNLKLSEARSQEVKQYLVKKQIELARLSARGAGESAPLVTEKTDADRQRNRRVEFYFTIKE